MPYPDLLHPEPLPLWQAIADPYRLRRHSNSPGLVSVGSLGPYVHKVCLSPLSISGRCGFDYKCDFAPPTILLGLLLCPWAWSISSQLLQYLPSYWDFSYLGHGVSIQGCSSEIQVPLLTLDLGTLLLAAAVLCNRRSLLQCRAATV